MNRGFVLFALVIVLGISAGLRDAVDQWITSTDLPVVQIETSVEVLDRHGKLLRVYPVEDGRTRLALNSADVDPAFLTMLISYEDKRFYRHAGVDLWAMVRAIGQAVRHNSVVSGGSTITMQVARLLENSGTGRWRGKLRQIRVALAMERSLSKEQILTLYLAHAPYGGPVEGLRAGTLAWFGKEPARLTLAEAALLVALPQAPEHRRPDRHPEAALRARARVLDRVNAPAQFRLADVPRYLRPFPRLAPHLSDVARRNDPNATRIATTLDAGLQAQAQDLARRAVLGKDERLSAAIVIADHQTGDILASVGSSAYSDADGAMGFVDMTRAVRSPGSTLKPLIYGMAFDQGLVHPETVINDAPTVFGRYAPQNFDGRFRGELTVREALQLSLNIPPVLLLSELGPARLMATLRRGGATPVVPGDIAGLAIALGGVGMTLNDLVQLYAGIARAGNAPALVWSRRSVEPDPDRLMSAAAAWHLWHILSDIPPPAQVGAQDRGIAYKTGTSYGHRDAWSIGFDGQHVIGVWLGRPDGTPVPGAFGGELAAPILFEAFGRVSQRRSPGPRPPMETLMVTTSELPAPLQRFRGRKDAFQTITDRPVVRFPPEGAVLRADGNGIPLKLRAGTLPFTILVNGKTALAGLRDRETWLRINDIGYSRIAVIDALGNSAAVEVELR